MQKVVIIGGVAGGATTAAQLRRINPDVEITIYDKHRDVSFANCGLPYLISGEVKSRDHLIAYTKEKFIEKSIDVKTYHEVIDIDTKHNKVIVKNLQTNTVMEDFYDYLVVSPGAEPNQLPVLEGANNVHNLHKLEDLDDIMHSLKLDYVGHVLVVGTGFVSLEVLESLVLRRLKVSLVHRSNHIYSVIEKDFADELLIHLKERGVDVYLDAEIEKVEGESVTLTTGDSLDVDMIFTGVGISPSTGFLSDTNIELTESGHIPINEWCQTNIENVFALGDAVKTRYLNVDESVNVALAGPAHRMAYLIAQIIDGGGIVENDPGRLAIADGRDAAPVKGLLGAQIIRVFDFHIGSVGVNYKLMDDLDQDVEIIEHSQRNMAGYMPESRKIHVKVYYEKSSGKILRVASMGEDKVDKLIDTFAAVMKYGGTVYDLIDLEPAYAPSFSSPKSVVNMIGYKALGKR